MDWVIVTIFRDSTSRRKVLDPRSASVSRLLSLPLISMWLDDGSGQRASFGGRVQPW